jgi:branched-chain amino acid aminotransferase
MATNTPLTPATSGTNTPTTASGLTAAGIKHNSEDPSAVLPGTINNVVSQQPPPPQDSPLAALDASNTTYTYTTNPRPVPAFTDPDVVGQRICTDHMITATWTSTSGWTNPSLIPYGPLQIMPNASVLHYATECFEGMKLYRGISDGKLRLFRPARNCARMRQSAARIALPDFDPEALRGMILDLCRTDGPKWLPDTPEGRGKFLYVRPTMIGTDAALGVQRPKEALLYVILAVFPDMSKNLAPAPPALSGSSGEVAQKTNEVKSGGGGGGLRLLASNEDTIRAWPGGFGYAKLGANYGPSLVAQGEARSRGFDQVLWLFGPSCVVTEAGASNFFVVWRTPESQGGRLQLITAPLEERIILEGITRASILDLARERFATASAAQESVEVVERSFTMDEIVQARQENRLVEAFAAGTAFFVAPVSVIHFRGQDLDVPTAAGDSGEYAKTIKQWLVDIMYGNVDHEWGVVVTEAK